MGQKTENAKLEGEKENNSPPKKRVRGKGGRKAEDVAGAEEAQQADDEADDDHDKQANAGTIAHVDDGHDDKGAPAEFRDDGQASRAGSSATSPSTATPFCTPTKISHCVRMMKAPGAPRLGHIRALCVGP